MTIIELLKEDDEACILNLKKGKRWLFWRRDKWCVNEDDGEEIKNLIEISDEEEAVKILLEGVKND